VPVQVELFKSLRSIHIADQQATEVVERLESHIAMKIAEATAPLRAELASSTARLEAEITVVRADIAGVKTILENQRWFMGAIIVLLAIIGLAPTFARIFH
jgi:ribosomal protein L29